MKTFSKESIERAALDSNNSGFDVYFEDITRYAAIIRGAIGLAGVSLLNSENESMLYWKMVNDMISFLPISLFCIILNFGNRLLSWKRPLFMRCVRFTGFLVAALALSVAMPNLLSSYRQYIDEKMAETITVDPAL